MWAAAERRMGSPIFPQLQGETAAHVGGRDGRARLSACRSPRTGSERKSRGRTPADPDGYEVRQLGCLEVLDVLDLGSPDEAWTRPLVERRPIDPNVDEVYEVVSGVDDCGDLRSRSPFDRFEVNVFCVPASRSTLGGVHESLFTNGGDDFGPFVVVHDGVRPPAIGWCGHVSKVPLPFGFSSFRVVSQKWDEEPHDSLHDPLFQLQHALVCLRRDNQARFGRSSITFSLSSMRGGRCRPTLLFDRRFCCKRRRMPR